jgi:multiple sugar transport system substrate-binding protein
VNPVNHQPDLNDTHMRTSPAYALSRRAFLRFSGIVSISAFLNGCLPIRNNQEAEDGKSVQLVYQDWRTDWFPPMAQEMLAKFHADHPSIEVFFVLDPVDFNQTMLDEMAAGTASDVFQGCCTHFPSWAQMGYTLDLQPYIAADLDQTLINDWDQAQYKALFTKDGLQFGLPKYHGALGLYFNKDLFDEYGVAYPDDSWDYDDYSDAMRRLTLDRDGDGQTDLWGSMFDITWDRIQIHVNGWGGHFVDPQDSNRCLMAETEALAAMEWLRARMWDDRVMATPLDVQNMSTRQAFIEERVAMVEDGSWALKDILSGANFRVGVAPFPQGPVRRTTLATTDGFGIYAGTQHPDEAWELVKFLISEEYGLAMARANFLQPARISLVDEWVEIIRNEFPEKAEGMNIAAFADGQRQGYSVTAEIFPNMVVAKAAAKAAWEEIFILGQAPVELMQEVCTEVEQAQEGSR